MVYPISLRHTSKGSHRRVCKIEEDLILCERTTSGGTYSRWIHQHTVFVPVGGDAQGPQPESFNSSSSELVYVANDAELLKMLALDDEMVQRFRTGLMEWVGGSISTRIKTIQNLLAMEAACAERSGAKVQD